MSGAMPRDHERQRHVQVLMDDCLASGQGMAPVGALDSEVSPNYYVTILERGGET
jgi:hypothetical protein